ncbi:hypothetical protein DL93DRAFT_962458 [Clavulina sp. PMI_390]|nr:hypothetical protein DL93DRAFT_962458 [Clavulina sp. PMI_390]
MWASIVKKLIAEHCIAPHSFSISEMSTGQLKAMAVRPYRLEYQITHPPKGHSITHFYPKIKPLQVILRPTIRSDNSTSPSPAALDAYSFHALPGARWVVGVPRSFPLNLDNRAPVANILCWDLAQVSQRDTELLPVAYVSIPPRSSHMPEIQYDAMRKTANILVTLAPREDYICMSLVQLSWPNGDPMLSIHSTTPAFASKDKMASLRLDGTYALYSSCDASGLLWNWKSASWGRVPPHEPLRAFDVCLRSPYLLRLYNEGENSRLGIFAIPELYPCSGPLQILNFVLIGATPDPTHDQDIDRPFWDAANSWFPPSPDRQRCDLQYCGEYNGNSYSALITIKLPPTVSNTASNLFDLPVKTSGVRELWKGNADIMSSQQFARWDVLPSGMIARFPTFINRDYQNVLLHQGETQYYFFGELIDPASRIKTASFDVFPPSTDSPGPSLRPLDALDSGGRHPFILVVSYSQPMPLLENGISQIFAGFDSFSGKLVHIRTVPPQVGGEAFLEVFLNVYTLDV